MKGRGGERDGGGGVRGRESERERRRVGVKRDCGWEERWDGGQFAVKHSKLLVNYVRAYLTCPRHAYWKTLE